MTWYKPQTFAEASESIVRGWSSYVPEAAVALDDTDVSDLLAQLEASIAPHPAGKKAPAKKAPPRQRRAA